MLFWVLLTLVDAHLIGVPCLGTLTVRCLTGGDLQVLGGQADGTLDAELLVLGTVDEFLAHLLERLDIARGKGDADLVDLGAFAEVLLGLVCIVLDKDAHCSVEMRGERTVRHGVWDRLVVWSVVLMVQRRLQSRPGSVITVM